jgi:hypothetical protein
MPHPFGYTVIRFTVPRPSKSERREGKEKEKRRKGNPP